MTSPAAAVSQRLVLDPPSRFVEGVVAQPHDVKGSATCRALGTAALNAAR